MATARKSKGPRGDQGKEGKEGKEGESPLFRGVVLLGLVLLVAVMACTWNSLVPRGRPITLPENAPRSIERLNLCEPVHGVLDCDDRQCNLWYRVDVHQPGRMRVQLELGEPEAGGRLTRVVLRPLGKPILSQQVSNQGEPIDISHEVEPDVYALLVQGAGTKRPFDLLVSMAPPDAPEDTGCP